MLIGHEGHEEVEGTMGEAPDHIVLIETEEDVDRLEVDDPERVAYISQTTLSVDETRAIILPPAREVPADRRARAPTTSATPRRTARRPSSSSRRRATSCS